MSGKLKLIKFGFDGCPPCKAMDKTKVLEKFVEAHPEVELIKKDVEEDKKAMKQFAAYGGSAVPLIVIETEDGKELARETGGLTRKGVADLYEAALKRLAYLEDDGADDEDGTESEEDETEDDEEGEEDNNEAEAD